MAFAHLCPFCGEHRVGETATVLDPACTTCGGTLHAVPLEELADAKRDDAVGPDPAPRGDGTAILALLVCLPWLLPLVGASLGDVIFAAPAAMLAFAAARLWRAGLEQPAWASVHRRLALACAVGGGASALSVASALVSADGGRVGLYAGVAASGLMLAAAAALVVKGLRGRTAWHVVDAMLVGLVVAAAGCWWVVVPGVRDGDAMLATVVAVDLLAVIVAIVGAIAVRSRGAWWLVTAVALVTLGDALASANAAGQLSERPWVTALLWTAAGFAIATAAEVGLARERERTATASGRRWLLGRVLGPLGSVLAFPAMAVVLHLSGALSVWGAAYFGSFALVALLLAFGRQAHLLHDHRNAALRERELREEAMRRSEELEALTGLATTMTQSLDEAPIVEQALGVLRNAARASSAALHFDGPDGRKTAAVAGRWFAERAWVPSGALEGPETSTRGRRSILRLPLAARGVPLGEVCLVRPAEAPFDPRGIELLRLLVGELGVAVQNARDYRERSEEATRDPLTGLHNRRYLLDALEQEVARSRRSGSPLCLAFFDLDDFKAINDTFGHGAGDGVLRAFAALAAEVVRPSDTLARIGGEEFALLLPETSRMDAVLVAERVRTAVGGAPLLADRRVTVSGGIASCPGDATTVETLQEQADGALYWAKRNGKDLCALAGAPGDGERPAAVSSTRWG